MVVKLGGQFAELFGGGKDTIKTIGDIVSSGTENMAKDGIRCMLAPAFGKESNIGELKKLDDAVKQCIAEVNRKLLEVPEGERTWETIQSVFNKSGVCKLRGSRVDINADPYTRFEAAWFKIDGWTPDGKTLDEVLDWWKTKAVPDEDIRNSTNIDIHELAKIVAWSGATVKDFATVFYAKEYHSKAALDIAALRYPHKEDPTFKLYRLEVTAYSECERSGGYEENNNGIRSSLSYLVYEPDRKFIGEIKKETRNKMLQTVESAWS